MIPTTRSRVSLIARAATPLALLGAAIALLRRFPPDQYRFYPRCPVFTYLHLQCPGCGTTRALAALLHGHLHQALQQNALTTLLLPFALFYAALVYYRSLRASASHRMRWPQLPTPALYTLLAITAVFTLARNL